MGRKTFVVLLLAVIIGSAFAQELPRLINYQGKLTDPTGVAIDGTANIVFRIYNAGTGGSLLWTETHSLTPVNNGLFDVILGTSTALSLPFDEQYWIELVVDGETLTPRQALNSVPYAYRAAIADSVVGGSGGGSSNWTLSGSSLYPNSTTSNVGVGMTSPSFKLEVQQTAGGPAGFGMKGATGAFNPAVSAVNDYRGFLVHTRVESGFPNMTSLVATGSVTGNYGGLMSFYTRNYGENPSERIRIDETGRVGIGTTSPTQTLDVNGATRLRGHLYDYNNTSGTSGQVLARGASGVVWQDAAGGVGGSGYWSLSGSNLYANSTTYNVGIGTTSPEQKLVVEQNSTGNTRAVLRNTNTGGEMAFAFSSASGQYYAGTHLRNSYSELRFYNNFTGGHFTFVNSGGSERMRITDGGDVGIGTTSPSAKLQVSGNAYVTTYLGVGTSPNTSNRIYASQASGNPAILGYNSFGVTDGLAGVAGTSASAGNGYLGTYRGGIRAGVYGEAGTYSSGDLHAGYFDGLTEVTGDLRVQNRIGVGNSAPARDIHIKQESSTYAIRMEHNTGTNHWEIGTAATTTFGSSIMAPSPPG